MLRKIRIVLATLMLVGVTILFLDITGTAHVWLGWMAKVQFLPAVLSLNVVVIVALVLLTLLVGRVYCSVICPLGILQDLLARLGRAVQPKRVRNRPYAYSPARTVLRFVVLGVFVLAMVAGIGSLVALLAPYSAYGRIASNLLQPLYVACNNLLAGVAEHYDSYAFYEREVWLRSVPTLVIAVVTLVTLAVLAMRGGRTYCNTVCPVGTVLGQLSRLALWRVHIDADKCIGCRKCEHHCKASCIDIRGGKTVDASRCVDCFDCLALCPTKAIALGRPRQAARPLGTAAPNEVSASETLPTNGGRRAFLSSAVTLAGAAVLHAQDKTVDGGLAVVLDKKAPARRTPIAPPGSRSAAHLAAHCTGCQLCVAQCPNNVLRPSAGLTTLMQPTMSYERGYCRPECNRCSEVCPAGAIRPIAVEVKASTKIGRAVWIRENCIPLTDGVKCGNCARHCPSGAISMVPSDKDDPRSAQIPVVDDERCIGCGACEHLCPARPFSAIYVEGSEVHRTL